MRLKTCCITHGLTETLKLYKKSTHCEWALRKVSTRSISQRRIKEMGEIWRPIEGYEGIYLVSNLGRVKSVDREIMEKTGIRRPIKGRILKPYIDKVGYKTCRLYKKGKYYQYELAEKFDIDPSQISRIINGTAWGWLKTDSQKEANIQ